MSASDGSMTGFVRARLDDLERTADHYHSLACSVVAVMAGQFAPCDCPEPNRRRRRAFTHRNLVDWAVASSETARDDGYNLYPENVLCHLAAEWSDHPDYQTRWAP